MSNSIKVEPTEVVSVIPKSIDVNTSSNTNVQLSDASKVQVSSRSYQIVSQDLYTIKRNSEIEPWFQDQINNLIDTGNLASEVGYLDDRFSNYASGVTLQVGYLQDADAKLAYDLSVVKVSNDNNTAGIQNLNVTKVTADEASAISSSTISAWQSGTGAAWFDSRVSAVSNVAYSAAKSASTLTASINTQQDILDQLGVDILTLAKQVDGKVETWTGHQDVVDGAGVLIPTAEPYVSWDAPDIHTGDTYVKTETNATTGKEDIIASWTFIVDASTKEYSWLFRTDDTANVALQTALDAGVLADGKATTFYQTYEPDIGTNPTMGVGDIWVDSDDSNKLYRYSGTAWLSIADTRISASVDRLDEATVDVNGNARAKSSLSVNANGVIGGFVAESDGSTSTFRVFADKFSITNNINGVDAGAPFSVDTVTNEIQFNGRVQFSSVDGSENVATKDDLNGTNGTVIDGRAIETGSVNADRFLGDSVWVNGSLRSSSYSLLAPYTSGFLLDANPSAGNPNIYGARIKGGYIYGTTIEGVTLVSSTVKVRDIVILTDAGYQTRSIIHGESTITPYTTEGKTATITYPVYGDLYTGGSIDRIASPNSIISFTGVTVATLYDNNVSSYKGWVLLFGVNGIMGSYWGSYIRVNGVTVNVSVLSRGTSLYTINGLRFALVHNNAAGVTTVFVKNTNENVVMGTGPLTILAYHGNGFDGGAAYSSCIVYNI